MSYLIALIAALTWAVHVSLPGLPAPAPVLLVFAAAIGGLTYMIAGTLLRDGLQPSWVRTVRS